ncbi:MAG: S8 family serine peptidase [Thermoanaerobaculia bacterium]|nr:S8 family serine peptidase [Thermoanaerobaculia bacterium]
MLRVDIADGLATTRTVIARHAERSRGGASAAAPWLLSAALVATVLTACASAPALPPAAGAAEERPALDESRADRQILVTVVPRGSWSSARAGTSSKAYAGRYGASARTRKLVRQIASDYELVEVEAWPMRPLGVHCIVFEVPEPAVTEQVVARLAKDERIESVEPMQIFSVESDSYNDPYLALQHSVDAMQVREAQRWSRGTGVRIAVVDTGIDLAHPELAEHVRLARDFVSTGGASVPPDHHGTAVAGIIVASVNNGIGIIGVAPAAEILALRACWQRSDEAPEGICNSFTLAKALVAAIEERPDVINLSLAGPDDPLLGRLLRLAVARGIVVVAARSDRPGHTFPAGVPGVVAVGAARAGGADASATRPELASLLAPGEEILTTVPGGGFDFVSGHSVAAAHVSGVAALLLELRPRLSTEEMAGLLSAASRREIAPGVEDVGLVNACFALARLVGDTACGG